MKQHSSPLPITVIVLTHDEEAQLADCLDSVVSWASELFVVDSGSTDGTLEIARRFTPHVMHHPFRDYAHQRNWAQDHLPIQHEWVLHLDASERVTPELARALRRFFDDGTAHRVNGAMIARRTLFLGRWIRHGGHYPVYQMRLFRRHKGRCEERLYDQHFAVEPPLIQMQGDLIDTLSADLDVWTTRHLRWAAAEASEQLAHPRGATENRVRPRLFGTPIERRRWFRARLYDRLPLFVRPFAYFIGRYLFLGGFRDGVEGLIFHVLQGFWYRFYVDAKIWETRHKLMEASTDASRHP